MFHYYLVLGVRNLLRNPILTTLMVLTLAVGVAASIATLTILHIMSGNPIPHKSAKLLVPLVDNGPAKSHVAGAPPDDKQTSYIDAANWRREAPVEMRTAVYDVNGAIEGLRPDLPVEQVGGLAVDSDYFAMFEVPFLHGNAWTRAEDEGKTRVIVVGRKKSEKLFGNENPVGKTIHVFGQDFRIVGVRDTWNPVPRYTRLINSSGGPLSGEDDAYIPFRDRRRALQQREHELPGRRAPAGLRGVSQVRVHVDPVLVPDLRPRGPRELPRQLRERAAQARSAQA